MCNPRRVMVHLTRTIEQAWRTNIEQAAKVEGQVQELARMSVDIPLNAEMADVALQMLERILRGECGGLAPWPRDDEGNYRQDLGDVVLVYQPGSRQLLVEARLTELISAQASSTAEAHGFTVGEVAVEAVGHYYNDGWGGRNEARARVEAQQEAEKRLQVAIDALGREQHSAEFQAATQEARMRAEQEANRKLEKRRTEMRMAMRERLQEILANAEGRVYHTINRLVGEAYRQTLIHLVHENGGRVLVDEQTGSVINLELELF